MPGRRHSGHGPRGLAPSVTCPLRRYTMVKAREKTGGWREVGGKGRTCVAGGKQATGAGTSNRLGERTTWVARRKKRRWKQDKVGNRTGRGELQRAPQKQGRRRGGGWWCRARRTHRRGKGRSKGHRKGPTSPLPHATRALTRHTRVGERCAGARAHAHKDLQTIKYRSNWGSVCLYLLLCAPVGGHKSDVENPDHAPPCRGRRGGRRLAAGPPRPRRRRRSASAVGAAAARSSARRGGQVIRVPPCVCPRLRGVAVGGGGEGSVNKKRRAAAGGDG